jgi:hypothetical protein
MPLSVTVHHAFLLKTFVFLWADNLGKVDAVDCPGIASSCSSISSVFLSEIEGGFPLIGKSVYGLHVRVRLILGVI